MPRTAPLDGEGPPLRQLGGCLLRLLLLVVVLLIAAAGGVYLVGRSLL